MYCENKLEDVGRCVINVGLLPCFSICNYPSEKGNLSQNPLSTLAFHFLLFCCCYYSASSSNIQLSLTSIFCEPTRRSAPLAEVSEVFQLLNNNENISICCHYSNGFFVSVFFFLSMCQAGLKLRKKVHSTGVKYLN